MATRVTPFALLADLPRKRPRLTWTDEENRIILSNVRRLGTQWALVAAQLPSRTADAVRNQCHRLQKAPGLNSGVPGHDDDCRSNGSSEGPKTGSAHGRSVWTAEEDRIICEGVDVYGCKWRRIAAMLPGRSDSSVRNRWSRICEGPSAPVLTSSPASIIFPDSGATGDAKAATTAGGVPLEPVYSVPTGPDASATTGAATYLHLIDPSTNFEMVQQMQQMQQAQQQMAQMQQIIRQQAQQMQQMQQMKLPPPLSNWSQPLPQPPPLQASQSAVPNPGRYPQEEAPHEEEEGIEHDDNELPSFSLTPRTWYFGEERTRSPSPVDLRPDPAKVPQPQPAPRLAVKMCRKALGNRGERRPRYRLAPSKGPRDDLPKGGKMPAADVLGVVPPTAAQLMAPSAAADLLGVAVAAAAAAAADLMVPAAAEVLPLHEFDELSSSDSARCLFSSEITSASRAVYAPPPAAVPDDDEMPDCDEVPGGDVAPLMRLFVDSLEVGLRPGPGPGESLHVADNTLYSFPVVA